jgi:tetratricopeptide (TPR) repeat protein
MKKLFLLFSIFIFAGISLCQTDADSLVNQGLGLYKSGKYEDAILKYKEALKLKPKELAINYEIAISYLKLFEYDDVIKYCDIILDESKNKDLLIQTTVVKGSALDYLGKTKKSIELYEECLQNVGEHYLLYFNLGIDYQNIKEYKKAEEAYINAINMKNKHPGSHYMLGKLMNMKGHKTKSLLCLYYFIYLEPNTKRSKDAYSVLIKELNGEGKVNYDDAEKKVTLEIPVYATENEFSGQDFFISLLQVSDLTEKNKDKSKEEIFIYNTKYFFELFDNKKLDKKDNIFWNIYIPFFTDLVKSDYVEIFCHFISTYVNTNSKSLDWLKDNEEKVKKFEKWLDDKKY